MRRPRLSDTRSVAVGGAVAAGGALARALYLRWGATDDELNIALPGDELVPDADLTATRAVTVRAPADGVWPWIAQPGQERGGLRGIEDRAERAVHPAPTVALVPLTPMTRRPTGVRV